MAMAQLERERENIARWHRVKNKSKGTTHQGANPLWWVPLKGPSNTTMNSFYLSLVLFHFHPPENLSDTLTHTQLPMHKTDSCTHTPNTHTQWSTGQSSHFSFNMCNFSSAQFAEVGINHRLVSHSFKRSSQYPMCLVIKALSSRRTFV